MSGIVSVEVVEEEDDDEEYEEHDQRGREEEAEPLVRFFPFPFTEELVQSPPYPLGSPERAAFRKLQQNKQMMKDIKGTYRTLGARGRLRGSVARPSRTRRMLTLRVVNVSWIVYRAYASNRQLVPMLGQPRTWKSHIHLACPNRPPPEWTQRG